MRFHCVGVVAHDSRFKHADRLAAAVEAVVINYDDGSLGCTGNHRIVAEKLSKHDSLWSIILEDDALPVDDFPGQAQRALENVPEGVRIASLYLGRRRPRVWQVHVADAIERASETGAAWIIADKLNHAVAFAVRTADIPALLDYTVSAVVDLPWDECVGNWARNDRDNKRPHPIAYCIPSLVDHDDQLPSVARHHDGAPRHPGRVAWQVGVRSVWNDHAVILGNRRRRV